MNNLTNVIIDVFLNQIFYEFKVLEIINLLNNDVIKARAKNDISEIVVKEKRIILKKTKHIITHAQIIFKIQYDFRHKFIDLKIKQNVYIKLHKKYF